MWREQSSTLIDPNFVNVPAELVLFPRCSAASEQNAARSGLADRCLQCEVVLPPQEYCPPEQPKIPTQEKVEVERTIPYTDEEMEEKIAAAIEDFESKPQRPSEEGARAQAAAQSRSIRVWRVARINAAVDAAVVDVTEIATASQSNRKAANAQGKSKG